MSQTLKHIETTLKAAYITALEADATFQSAIGTDGAGDYKIYDSVPADTQTPYAYFASFTDIDTPTTKDVRGHECTLTITVVRRYNAEEGGWADVSTIVNAITQVICPAARNESLDLSASNLKMVTSKLDNVTDFTRPNSKGGKLFGISVRFRHLIYQIA